MSQKKSLKNDKVPTMPASGKSLDGMLVIRLLTVLFLIVNILLIYGIFLSPQGILGYRQQCSQVRELEQKVLALKKKNHKLFNKIQSLKRDPHAQERLVRQQLGWVHENELMIEFAPPRKDSPEE